MKISKRSGVAPFYAMEILCEANARAADGADVLHLETGEPTTGAPDEVKAAAAAALENAHLGYTEAMGMWELRRRIARHYKDYYGLDVPVERIMVTTGSSGGLLLTFIAAFDAGDRVALADPGYPAYRNMLHSLDILPVTLPSTIEDRYQPTVSMLEALNEPVDGLIIASPANPTGTMLHAEDMAPLIDFCDHNGIRIISDEVYHGITFGKRAVSALSFTDKAIISNGFSKYYAMTGWRLGWTIFPKDLIRPAERLAQNLFVAPPALPQHAALHAFDCVEELDVNVERYRENGAILRAALAKAGFGDVSPAEGAFYLYVDVTPLTNDSEAFCHKMLAEAGVAATPGIDFDDTRGARYVRFSFAGSTAAITAAGEAINRWLDPHRADELSRRT